jgi:hypothetical protein
VFPPGGDAERQVGASVEEALGVILAASRAQELAGPTGVRLHQARCPGGVTWVPLIGNPLARRTWAVWAAASTRRDLAALVAVLDLTAG